MYKILIIDDEEIIREAMPYIIDYNSLGFEITASCSNGEEALEFIKQHGADVAIVDLNMPKMDGLELIKQVRTFNQHIRFIISTGYAEFEYARQAMIYGVNVYLLKPIEEEELESALISIKDELSNQQNISELYMHHYVNSVSRSEYTPAAGGLFYDAAECYRYIEITADEDTESFNSSRSNKRLIDERNKIYEVLKSMLNDKNSYTFYSASDNSVAIILPLGKNVRYTSVRSFTDELSQTLSSRNVSMYSVLIGKKTSSLSDISESKKSIKQLENVKYYAGVNVVLDFDTCCKTSFNSVLENTDIIDDIISSANYPDIVGTRKNIDGFIKLICEKQLMITAVKMYVNTIVVSAIRSIKNVDAVMRLMSFFNEYNKINSITLEKTKLFLYDFFDIAIESITSERKKASMAVISEILDYINKNYKENLTMQQISSLFFMNTAYLGRLFKKKTGKSFNSYLNEIRIKAAKSLLESTSLKIHEISKEVGYNDFNYFVTKFESIEALSPKNYRNKYIASLSEHETAHSPETE